MFLYILFALICFSLGYAFSNINLMFRHLTAFVFCILIIGIQGCATFSGLPNPTLDNESTLTNLQSNYTTDSITECNKNLTTICRNNIIESVILATDINYYKFEAELSDEDRGVSFFSTIVEIGLNATGAISGVKLYSIISSAVIGANASYTNQLLVDKMVSSIQQQMNANRAIVKTNLVLGMNQPITNYSLNTALNDLESYYNAGTLNSALNGITTSTTTNSTTANVELQNAISSTYSNTTTSVSINKWIYVNGGLVQSNLTSLEIWLKQNNYNNHVSMFINDSTSENLRLKAINDLKIPK